MGRTIFCPPGPLPLRKDSWISSSGGGLGREGICVFLVVREWVVVKGADFGILILGGGVEVIDDDDDVGWRQVAIARGMTLLQRAIARGSSIVSFYVYEVARLYVLL